MPRWLLALALTGCAAASTPIAAPAPQLLAQLDASRDLDGATIGSSDAPATIVVVFASWCPHCRDELRVIDAVRARHRVRILGVNYKGHEDYDHRGGSDAVRAFARDVPWLRVVPADDALFDLVGRPALIPTILVYDRAGALAERFDRRERAPPDAAELDALLARLGA